MKSDEDEEEGKQAIFDADPSFAAFQIKPSVSREDARFPGAQVLAAGTPTRVHELLVDGDPLGVTQICVDRMEEQAILLDPVRVLRATMARVAHDSFYYAGEPELQTWLAQCVDKAVLLVISEATEREMRGDRIEEGEVPLEGPFSSVLGVEKTLVRRALLHFQSLPLAVRRTFCAVLVRGQSLESWSEAGNGSVSALEEQVMLAVETMTSTDIPAAPSGLEQAEPETETRKERRKLERQRRKEQRRRRGGSHD